jgi:ribonuclease Z
MSFELTILGSSSAVPTSKRFPTAHVLKVHERFFLIDCGEGTQMQLKRFSVNFSRINHIFISHLHGDHVFGIFGLLSTYGLLGRKNDVHIYAHRDFEATLNHFQQYFGGGLTYKIVFHPFIVVKPEVIYSDKHVTVELIPLRHSIPVAGFIFSEKERPLNIRKEVLQRYSLSIKDIRNIKEGKDFVDESGGLIPNVDLTLPPYKARTYAFCTDTVYFTKLVGYLKDIDLLYFESTFADADKKLAKATGHSTSIQAANLAKTAGVGKLLIGHFSTRYKDIEPLVTQAREVFSETYAVEDGQKFSVRQERLNSPQ